MLNLNSTIVVAEEVEWKEVDEEILCLDLQGDRVFGLDEMASKIWSGLAQGCSLGEMIQGLHEEYEVDWQTLQADVIQFAEMLLDQELFKLGASLPTP